MEQKTSRGKLLTQSLLLTLLASLLLFIGMDILYSIDNNINIVNAIMSDIIYMISAFYENPILTIVVITLLCAPIFEIIFLHLNEQDKKRLQKSTEKEIETFGNHL